MADLGGLVPADLGGLVPVDLGGLVPADLVGLAGRCLRADGGMPQAADPAFLRRRWSVPGAVCHGLRTADGSLVAAVAVAPTAARTIVTGLVDPAARGRGLGARILDHGLAVAGAGRAVTVETESATEAAVRLFASRGLAQVFAEDVMRIGLAAPPAGGAPQPSNPATGDPLAGGAVAAGRLTGDAALGGPLASDGSAVWPGGAARVGWSPETAARFHAVYQEAFRERPGFPGHTAAEWIADTEDDDGFRADWSALAALPGIGDAGFVTAATGWIVQVGVVPAARRRGLAGALIGDVLARMTAAGATEAWLTVNVDNPGAAGLYRRLGFAQAGRRGRFQPR